MAILTGQTLTRELTSKSQGQLSELVAKAFSPEEAYGYDEKGLKIFDVSGGTKQVNTVAIKWKESVAETKQKFLIDLAAANTALEFAGVSTKTSKKESITLGSTTGAHVRGEMLINGIVFNFNANTSSEVSTLTGADLAKQIVVFLNGSRFSNLVQTASRSGAVVTITYTAEAGSSIETDVKLRPENQTLTSKVTNRTLIRAFVGLSPSAQVSLEVTQNDSLNDNNDIQLSSTTGSFNIATGGTLHWYDIANGVVDLIDGSTGIDGRVTVTDGYLYTASAGYAISALTIKMTMVRDGVTTKVDVKASLTGTGTVTHVKPITETFGTLRMSIQDPSDSHVHQLVISVPENSSITDVEKLIENAVNTVVIDVQDGKNIYLSSVATITTSAITRGTDADSDDTSNFTVTISFGVEGVASVSVNTDSMNSIASDFDTVATETAGVAATPSATGIEWKHVTTSSTLQPGGDTTHFATLIFTK